MRNPVDNDVGARVRMRRLSLGMSQTSLADALGISFQQVQKYEQGKNRISASRLQHISSLFRVSVSFFFHGQSNSETDDTGLPNYVREFITSSESLRLAKVFLAINDRRLRGRIVKLVEEIAEYQKQI